MIPRRGSIYRSVFFTLSVLSWLILGAFSPIDAVGMERGILPLNNLLQLRAGGHILGFNPQGVYLASPDHALSVGFVGVEGKAKPVAFGSTKTGSHPGAPLLNKVIYKDLWRGIDLRYEVVESGIMQSTYTISPGAEVSRIRLRYNVGVELQGDGSLMFNLPKGRGYMVETKPLAWQEIDGRTMPVEVRFTIRDGTVGFSVGGYDPLYPLIIDPTYQWHTFYGSVGGHDGGYGIAVDGSGNVYVSGYCDAAWQGDGNKNPLHSYSGGSDIFILKLNANGAYQWHTFYGSLEGNDIGYGIAVDGSGSVYITGYSDAAWLGDGNKNPLHAYMLNEKRERKQRERQENKNWDIFILKLNADGAYQWHTFYGSFAGNDVGYGIAVDGSGNVYVTGYSTAAWLGDGDTNPKHAYTGNDWYLGNWEIVVLKLNANGAYQWHTFYGSTGNDWCYGIAIDSIGNVYVTGESNYTWLGDGDTNPIHAYTANFDIVILKLNANGVYQWHTFYGSVSNDWGHSIALDRSGDVYVTGYSGGAWLGDGDKNPIHSYVNHFDIFVLKLNGNGAYQWHTFYGSGGTGGGYGIAVDRSGNVYVTGRSWATWQGERGANPKHAYRGERDKFVLKLNGNGTYQWHTFYGSLGGDDQGWAIGVDGSGNVYTTGQSNAAWQGDSEAAPIHPYSWNFDITVLKLAGQQ
jgi:hypothetical protein